MTLIEQSERGSQRENTPPKVSIVIPALNEERMIRESLCALTRSECPPENFEVLVVDNGSSDGTVESACSFAKLLDIQVFQEKYVCISALRNIGARHARGEILAFLDADCIVGTDWLTRVISVTSDRKRSVLGAYYGLPQNSTWVARTWHRYHYSNKQGEVSYLPGGNLVIRRDDFLRIGGFDESIQTNEDYEVCQRAWNSGLRVIAVPEIAVIHLGTAQNLGAFYRKQRWHGRDVLRVFLRDVRAFHNGLPVGFALYTLAGIVAAVAGLVSATAGHFRLLSMAVLALLLPPLALSMRNISRTRWYDIFPLCILYLVYGAARADALIRNISRA